MRDWVLQTLHCSKLKNKIPPAEEYLGDTSSCAKTPTRRSTGKLFNIRHQRKLVAEEHQTKLAEGSSTASVAGIKHEQASSSKQRGLYYLLLVVFLNLPRFTCIFTTRRLIIVQFYTTQTSSQIKQNFLIDTHGHGSQNA